MTQVFRPIRIGVSTIAAGVGCLIPVAIPVLSDAQVIKFADRTALAHIATMGPAQGVAVADVNGDGYDDVFLAAAAGASGFFLNNGDATFRDATSDSHLETPGDAVAPVWVDFNNDGALDLFVGIRSGTEANRLFLNNGSGVFENVIAGSGIDANARIGSAAFGDFDGDGLVDLFLATRGDQDLLYRNSNGLTFENVTADAGVQGQFASVAMQSMWVDYDRDGDVDLFAVHDGVVVNRLYRNDGSLPLVEIAAQVGIDQVGSGNGMGVAWFDSDLDGDDDVYVTRIGVASLYRHMGDGTFEDVATSVGAEKNGMTWGIVAADFDNDGDEDLFLVNTFSYDAVSETFLYRNDSGLFTNVARSVGAALKLDAFGVAAGDFNADGLVDIVVTSTAGDNRLLLNESQGAGNWIEVDLRNTPESRLAVGSSVRIVADHLSAHRSVFAGQGYCSQNTGRLHFGIGVAENVDSLEIVWPGGEREVYEDLDANKSYVLTKGSETVTTETVQVDQFPLSIDAAYPNPFSDQTHIRFALAARAEIDLDVVDLLGRRVATLASGLYQAGAHNATWSGSLDRGGTVPAGVYVLRLVGNGRSLVRTVVRSN